MNDVAMESYMGYLDKQRKELHKKNKWLKCAMGIDAKYHELSSHEVEHVGSLIFKINSIVGIKRTYEELGGRMGSYFIFRFRNRIVSEMLELMVLLVASRYHPLVEKCRANDRKKDIKINGVGYDLKIQFSKPNADGRLEYKDIRDYEQKKIIFLFTDERKDYIYNHFMEFFENGILRLEEVVDDVQRREYETVIIKDMCKIKYCM
jgi:hypothetical protein